MSLQLGEAQYNIRVPEQSARIADSDASSPDSLPDANGFLDVERRFAVADTPGLRARLIASIAFSTKSSEITISILTLGTKIHDVFPRREEFGVTLRRRNPRFGTVMPCSPTS